MGLGTLKTLEKNSIISIIYAYKKSDKKGDRSFKIYPPTFDNEPLLLM